MYSASTCQANDEACSGHNGTQLVSCINSIVKLFAVAKKLFLFIPPPKNKDHRTEAHQSRDTTQPNDIKYRESIFTGSRVVMVTVQEQLFGRIADLILTRLHKSELDVPGCVVYAVKIT